MKYTFFLNIEIENLNAFVLTKNFFLQKTNQIFRQYKLLVNTLYKIRFDKNKVLTSYGYISKLAIYGLLE